MLWPPLEVGSSRHKDNFHMLRGGWDAAVFVKRHTGGFESRTELGFLFRCYMNFECLFLNDSKDNVATALNTFEAFSVVPVVTSEGKKVRTLLLRAHVPVFFKVNISPLSDHEPIIKLGGMIGKAVARVADLSGGEPNSTISIELPAGLPIHDANFLFSQELWERWEGGIAHPLKVIFEQQYATKQSLFKLARAVKTIPAKSLIQLRDLDMSELLRQKMFEGIGVDENTTIGRTLFRIPKHGYLRVGCCEEKEYNLPIDTDNVDILVAAYRHSQSLAL